LTPAALPFQDTSLRLVAVECGALIEAGAALAAGKRVFIVSPYIWSFANHPRCRRFGTLAEAIKAIRAADQGRTSRRREVSRLPQFSPCSPPDRKH
jgi:hypothetical protein